MLLSLLVYSITGVILFYLGWHINRREQNHLLQGGKELPFYSWEVLLSLLVFSIVAGARYHTGYDHAMYLNQYLHLQETGEFSRHNFEYGFEWISKLFAWCHVHYFFYFAFWALLQIGFLYFGLRHHKHLLCWVGMGIMLGPYFVSWMNSVRQSVVVCVFVALIPLIRDRKFLLYAGIVIVCSFLHKSSLMLLPVFLICFIRIRDKLPSRWLFLGIFAVFVLIGSFPFWTKYFTNYQWFIELTGYSNYGNLDDPNVGGTMRMVSWGPLRISVLLSNIAIIWFYPQLKSYFKNDNLLPYYFILAFVGLCLSNLLMNTTHFILRPVDYFLTFNLIMTSYLLCYLYRCRYILAFVIVAIVNFSYFFMAVMKAVYFPLKTSVPFLYHFFLCPSI